MAASGRLFYAIQAMKSLKLRYTIETHMHTDHLSGSVRLRELTDAQILRHAAFLRHAMIVDCAMAIRS